MEETEHLPRFSYDLITFLDETVARPDFPHSADQFAALDDSALRRAAFTAGARELVDQLLSLRAEMEEADTDDTPSVSDGPPSIYPQVFDPSGDVREISSPVRLVNGTSE